MRVYCLLFLYFPVGACTLQMQDAVLSRLCAPPAVLCAVTVMYQERKEQAASVD